jgi:RNA polymerase sigma-70 factor, ECF subfamily
VGLVGESDAEDVQQVVWLTVFRRIQHLSNPHGFRTWLFQITRRKALDELRGQRRRMDLFEALVSEPTDQAAGLNTDGVDLEEELKASLNALSPAHRDVVMLRYWEQMSYTEIALVVGRPVGTIRSRLHHAKATLRKSIEEAPRHDAAAYTLDRRTQ